MADPSNQTTDPSNREWGWGGGGAGPGWRHHDQYGEVTPEGKLQRDILAELRAIRALLEKQNVES